MPKSEQLVSSQPSLCGSCSDQPTRSNQGQAVACPINQITLKYQEEKQLEFKIDKGVPVSAWSCLGPKISDLYHSPN